MTRCPRVAARKRSADAWADQGADGRLWDRLELWLFDFHHHLFAGETGELITGVAGLTGLLFIVTGLILWWRSRRAFRLRLLPKSWAPGPIVSHHRDIGLLASPFLLAVVLNLVLPKKV